jgi:hypothetical protein
MDFSNKRNLATISLIMILTISALVAIFPVGAQDLTDGSTSLPTFLMLSAAPNPIGIGQTLYVNPFMTQVPETGGFGGTGVTYEGIVVEVNKPDGTTVNYDMEPTDTTGGTWFEFVPDQLGDWTLQAHYPEQHIEATVYSFFGGTVNYNFTYLASDSAVVTVTVQSEPAEWNYQAMPLPDEYWTRPIYSTNWEWGEKLGGSWFGLDAPAFADTGRYDANGNFNPFSQAPNTGHIMWSKATHFGGQPGGPIVSDQSGNFKTTTIINNYFDPIVLNGVLYYCIHQGPSNTIVGWNAIDIRTGEVLWTKETDQRIKCGQTFRTKSIQEYGSWSIIWGQIGGGFFGSASEYVLYDAFSGLELATIQNPVTTDFLMDTRYGHEGTLLAWYTSGGNLTLWNSSRLHGGDQIVLSVSGDDEWDDGIEWSVPVPSGYSVAARTMEVILLRDNTDEGFDVIGMDSLTGAQLWGPVSHTLPEFEQVSLIAAGECTFVYHNKDRNQAHGYSLVDGSKLWGPVQLPGNAWSAITRSGDIAYGKVFIWDFGGFCYALDLETGNIEWTWSQGPAGLDTPYGTYELWYNNAIADGKIILSEGKMYDPPLHPAKTVCIDVETGETVWTLTGWTGRNCPVVADGHVILWNSQDAKIYSVGKGPTTTTLTAGPKTSALGTTVVLEGSVMDISAGSKQAGVVERFPNGIPCAADSMMDEWMSYVYMQQVRPSMETFMGVDVRITGYDPNGNFKDWGYTCTDMNGNFAFPFVPEVPGTYQIMATFEGTESYWRSTASTYLAVDPAPVDPGYQGPTAEEIAADAAQRTIAMLPPYPDVPTQEQVAADAAQRTIAMMPQYPECPDPCPEMPMYLTIDIVIIVLVVVAIAIGIFGLLKKK